MTPEYMRNFAVPQLFRKQAVSVNIITQFSQQIALPSEKIQSLFTSLGKGSLFGPRVCHSKNKYFWFASVTWMCASFIGQQKQITSIKIERKKTKK